MRAINSDYYYCRVSTEMKNVHVVTRDYIVVFIFDILLLMNNKLFIFVFHILSYQ